MSSSLSLEEVLAQRLHKALCDTPVLTLDDIYGHPGVVGLHPETVGKLIDHLVATGRLADDEYGRLVIAPAEVAR